MVETEVEKKIEQWHRDWSIKMPLHQFLGWSYADYVQFVETGMLPICPVSVVDHTPLS